jgi:hypothetical protein
VRASIEKSQHNTLALDDSATAVTSGTTLRRALLVTRGNRFIEQVLSVLPNLQVSRATNIVGDASVERNYDLYVIDNTPVDLAALPPQANVLLIGTQQFFSSTAVFSNTGYVRAEAHPIMQSVNWRTVNVQQSAIISAPTWLKPIVESQGGALLYAGQSENDEQNTVSLGRVVLVPFELRRSDLPLQLAFPILMANAVEWLAPSQGLSIPPSVKPGEVVPLPNGAIVRDPSGREVIVNQRGYADTNQVGAYTVQVGDTRGAFAVNFFNSLESDITPNASVTFGAAAAPAEQPKLSAFTQREIWRWAAALALVLLLVEWWVYQRGVPSLRRNKADNR